MVRALSRRLAGALTASLVVGGLAVVGAVPGASVASAAPAPLLPPSTSMASADALPTVQVDGVVWSQAVVGNTVFAGGRFNNARPAGAAPGTNLTPRSNLLAYDIATGNLVTSFAPSLNGQVLSVAATPDGSRIYVVGDFTTANGQARRRIAAYSTATGQLISSFAPSGPNSQARAVVASNDTVYVGGGFAGAGSQSRGNLAAYRASDGALLNWNPNADYTVWAIAVSADGSSVFAGGSFQNVGGQPAYGLAKINASTGALQPWNATSSVRSAGPDAGITSLRVQNGNVYGTAWHFGPGGNLEGTFKAPVGSGDVEWVTDCHGDMYSSFLQGGVVYAVGHAHYCGNHGGGFPQYSTWKFQHTQAWTDTPDGEILNDVHGYPNWHGVEPAPSMINWLPDTAIGSFTGQYQAGWSVTGNNDYVVIGGEFPRVNGVGQQGLVRFARRTMAPRQQGPRFLENRLAPTLVPTSPTSLRVSWLAGFDRDDLSLQYQVFRAGTTLPRHTTTANSNWWMIPSVGFTDTGLTAGQTYTYRIIAKDSDGNTVNGSSVSVTMPASVPTNAYANRVRADGATLYWPLNEAVGQVTVIDRAGVQDGRAGTGVTWARPGAISGDAAARLASGNDSSRIHQVGIQTAPDTFSAQAWFRTDTGQGGRILGFSDLQTGGSGHRDRHVYMNDAGQLTFGVRAQDGSLRIVSSAKRYNDDQWHQVTATMGADGMRLYVDGVRVASRADTTAGEAYLGHWRVGGDNLGWPNGSSNPNFTGDVDEVAIYPTALGQDQIIAQYELSGRTSPIPPVPTDAYGAAVYADNPEIFWRLAEASGSTAADSGRSMNSGTYRNGVDQGQDGVLAGNGSARFDGDDDFVSSDAAFSNPTTYTEEAWFKTTSDRGGKIVGFGGSQDGSSSNYDRHVYLRDDGRLVFGVWTGQTNTITTPAAFNDGAWHHVVATQSAAGMKLYVDGELIGTHPQTAAQDYTGYWKVGGDNTWGSSSAYLAGTIDEVAIYSYELGADRVEEHFVRGGGVLNQDPTAAFTSTVEQRRVTFDGTGSADGDGSVVGYAWDFGDGGTGSGATPQHVYAPGTYTVKLTVTDNRGAAGSISQTVTVAAPPGVGDAYGAAVVADSPELFWRFGDAAGPVAADSSGALNPGTYFDGYELGEPGALPIADTATRFDGSSGFASSDVAYENPTTYSEEAWFKTTSDRGGKIVGFGTNRTGISNSYDRHVYMQDDGHLVFGTWTGQANTITSGQAYNDGQWHHVVATQSGNGMKLYVDGTLVGTNQQTQAEPYTGHWKVGGDRTWGSSSDYFDGLIDEVAVYLRELSAARVAAHYAAAAPVVDQPPVATFTSTPDGLTVAVDGTGSSDPDGTIAAWSWNWGDGTPASTGANASHVYGEGGTYTVTLTVTDDDGLTDTVTASVTVVAAPANQAPTAAFTGTKAGLTATADGSGSSDPDGTIASWSWNWGDGTPATTGVTSSHTYQSAGTYTVTLTVTDDDGATDIETGSVTVTAPPVNQPPVAAFTSTPNGLGVGVNGSGSSDPDGTIASWSWNWGDGTPASTGAQATHTYGAAGTYTVTLTVTDNQGATDMESGAVTVTAVQRLALDTFTRSGTGGLGTADVGGVWTVTGASQLSVNGSAAQARMNVGQGPSAYLNGVSAANVDAVVDLSSDKAGTGGGIYESLVVRRVGTSDYRAKVRITATATTLSLVRNIGGTETTLASQVVPGFVYQPGQVIHLRLRATGTGTTSLAAALWVDAQPEPTTWNLTATDSTPALQNPGGVGVYTYLSGSATNGPVTVSIDNFDVISA